MGKLLVTGAAGFIGSHIAQRLLARGDEVVGVDNFITGQAENIARGDRMRFVDGDVRDLALMRKLCEGVDCVFHQAALVSVPESVEDPVRAHDHNVDGTLGVLVAARDAGVRRVIYASSAAVYGDDPRLPSTEDDPLAPASPYALHKQIGELYLALFRRAYGLEGVALRYFNVYGRRQATAGSGYAAAIPGLLGPIVRGERPTIFDDGEQTRDFVCVDDVVEANLLAAETPAAAGSVFNIGGGGRVSINSLAGRLLEITDGDLQPEHIAPRPGDVRHSGADISRAREILGFEPASDPLAGLPATVDWYRGQLA